MPLLAWLSVMNFGSRGLSSTVPLTLEVKVPVARSTSINGGTSAPDAGVSGVTK